jgi:hypothetical protein
LPPAAEVEIESGSSGSRGWWRRREHGSATLEQELPRHVRVLPGQEPASLDPWEEGFNGPRAVDENEEPVLVEDEGPRRFRRR